MPWPKNLVLQMKENFVYLVQTTKMSHYPDFLISCLGKLKIVILFSPYCAALVLQYTGNGDG